MPEQKPTPYPHAGVRGQVTLPAVSYVNVFHIMNQPRRRVSVLKDESEEHSQ